MVLTPQNIILLLAILADLMLKIVKVQRTGEPQDITKELEDLQQLRLRPSEEIIKEADAISAPQSEAKSK